jgi:Putative peptidoglycan binding domain
VRKRRTNNAPSAAAAIATGAALLWLRFWAKAARRPVDTLAILSAVAASLVVIVNAVFLQSGSHPAPFFVNTAPPPPPAAEAHPNAAGPAPARPAEPTASMRSPAAAHTTQTVAMRRNDPIAELLGSSSRVAAVQRVLSEFGYGQIKPSGILDEATSTAIERFEREHKLPVTGLLSDRLVRELASMSGRPLD